MTEPDMRSLDVTIGDTTYAAPLRFDGVCPKKLPGIGTIPWFSRNALLTDGESYFEKLFLYAWDGKFYCGVYVETSESRMWRDIVAGDDMDLSYYGSADVKRVFHVRDVSKGMISLSSAPLVEKDVDVDIWCFSYYREPPHVHRPCSLPAEKLTSCRGRFMVKGIALLWHRAIIPTSFRYGERGLETYCTQHVCWERRTISAFDLFVLYHLMCFYHLTETALDRFFVRISTTFTPLEVCHAFRYQYEPVFSYTYHVLIRDRDTGVWIMAYTERVERGCDGLLLAVYGKYGL